MKSSRWQAQGNVYLVAEMPLTAELVRAEVGDADGILEIRDRGQDWLQIAIWNPDGSLAEMSGNGTRIAAAWLAEQTGARAAHRVGRPARGQGADARRRAWSSRRSGRSSIGEPEEVDGIRFTPVDVGNPHAVVEGDPADLDRIGPHLETHPHFPNRTNVQVARRLDAVDDRGESLGARRGRDRRVGHRARSRSSRRSAAAPQPCAFQAAIFTSRSTTGGPC